MTDSGPTTLDLPDADVVFHPTCFDRINADRLFSELLSTTAWRQETITLYGRPLAVPRLTAWYGDAGTGYTYSGITNVPSPWTPTILEVKADVERVAGRADQPDVPPRPYRGRTVTHVELKRDGRSDPEQAHPVTLSACPHQRL